MKGKTEAGTGAAVRKTLHSLHILEDGLCYFSFICITLLALAELIARFFKTGIPAYAPLLTHFMLLIGILGGMITTRSREHLSIALIQYVHEGRIKRFLSIFTGLLSAFTAVIIAWCTVSFIKIGLTGRMIGFLPDRFFALILPIGFTVMSLRFALAFKPEGALKILPVLAIAAGCVCSFPAIAKIIWDFNTPDGVYDLLEKFHTFAYYAKIPAAIILIIAGFAGTPLFVVIGGLALLLIQASWGEMDVTANQIYTGLTQDSIIPIPLFTLTGFILSESKAGTRLVETFKTLFGWMPGGMIIVTVIICAFFTSFTGASGVTILALGGILFTILAENSGYSQRFSIGLLTSVGSIGLLFPPSLPLILVGATTQTNIFHLFLGGIIPGLILVAAVIIFSIIISVKTRIPTEPLSLGKAFRAVADSLFELLLPFILLLGYFSGILASLTELGAVSVIYVFIVEVLVRRDIKISEMHRVFRKAVPIIGGVLAILAMAQGLSYYIVDTQIPETFARWLPQAVSSKFLFLLFLNLSLLVVGCLMDIFSAILIVLPLIFPLGAAYGIHPVHLGIIFIINLEVGFLTPPVGLNLFLASYRFKKPFVEICRDVFPFLLIQFAVVILVTYVPWLSMCFIPE
ncbi:MAG: TRAP transporter large permease subunit [Treponema sp.]|jgi:tripartite ATP-independent transporter DctM subunit|nr:TRAP transporter large permease subunit [Treponema sp.]